MEESAYELVARPCALVPYVLEVVDASQPVTAPRCVARCDTRDGKVWRTKGAHVRPTMREIRAAIAEVNGDA